MWVFKNHFGFMTMIVTSKGILLLEKLVMVFIALKEALTCKMEKIILYFLIIEMEKIILMNIKKESSCTLIYLENYSIK